MPESECLSEMLLEQSPACLWMVREDLVFQRIWGSADTVFGKTSGELTGRCALDVLPRNGAGVVQPLRAGAGGRNPLPARTQRQCHLVHLGFPGAHRKDGTRYAGGMAREITPWKTAEQELRNTVLSALKAQEFERNMLSKFLHDVVGQNLTALGLQLDLARMDVESVSPETCVRITEIQKVLETIMEQVREYSYHLNPSAVERAGCARRSTG
jgi:signal transduction histidine kinase